MSRLLSAIALPITWPLLLLTACGGGSDGGTTPPAPTSYAVSVTVSGTMGTGESFVFGLGTQQTTVTAAGTATVFATALAAGSSYTVSQLSGPRTCTLSANRSGTISAAVNVTADCGAPPVLHAVSVTVSSAMAAGETFVFGLGAQQVSTNASGVATSFANPLAAGSSYTVNQLSGPRTCTLSASRSGTITAPVSVTADCGTPVAPSPLLGRFYGPTGAQATLASSSNNVSETLAVAIAGIDTYGVTPFQFNTLLAAGSSYAVTVPSAGSNLGCRVYKGASGSVPVAAGALRAGCELSYDRITRNSANTQTASFFETYSPVIGGSNDPIGATTSGAGEGRYVAFVSDAAIAGASGSRRQIFLRDRLNGTLKLISTSAAGVEGNGASDHPAISADGLTIAYESAATNLVAGDANGVLDVYVYSVATGQTVRASVGSGGTEYTAASGKPALSGDGRVLAFETIRSNVLTNVAGSDNETIVVRRDLVAGSSSVVSRNGAGKAVNGREPQLSDDGNRIAFWSFAADLVSGDNNGLWDIFVADVAAGTMQRVTLTSSGGERNQGNESASRVVTPAISGDGRWVAWSSTASNVVPGDSNGTQDVFITDTQTGAVVRASVATNGAQADADAPIAQGDRLSLTRDGTWVAFTSTASTLGVATTTTGIGNVFLHNRVTGETRSVTQQSSSGSVGSAPMLSREGAYVVFGASTGFDPRYAGSGQFAHFTNLSTVRAFAWPLD